MAGSKKASNGTSQGRRSKSASVPPVQPPTSDAAVPSSDSIALPGPSSKKLFPLFDSRSKKTNGKTSSLSQVNSDVESTTGNMSEGSQASTAQKGKKKATAAVNGTAKAKVKSDASSNTASSTLASNGSNTTKVKKSNKKSKSRSPLIDDVDIYDLDTTTSTVASTSTSHTTPPPQPHKTVITITDSPVRELKPIKTFADLNAERQAKKAAKEAGGWNGGRSPLWPTRENMHVPTIKYHSSHEGRMEVQKRDWKGKGRAVEADCLLDNDEQTRRYASIAQTDTSALLERYTSFESSLQADPSSSSATQEAKSILDESTLKRLKAVAEDASTERLQQTWYQRYATMRAVDVLGDRNKENAFYLRDWLRELTLQGEVVPGRSTDLRELPELKLPSLFNVQPIDPLKIMKNFKKRKIKREITCDERKRLRRAAKRRKRKGYDGTGFEEDHDDTLDDFIAADDEIEYDHYEYYNLSDVDAGNGSSLPPSPTKSTTSTSSHQGPSHYGRFEPLTNVILLTGPVASGKTSTAYAVANELNWQVFEVYPGIGKRGYKDLEKYVGMVGENHIMKRETTTAAAAAPPISSFFGKAATSTSTSTSQTSQSTKAQQSNGMFKQKDFVDAVSSNMASTSNGTSSGGSKSIDSNTVKQSCILIEEVDNLYESDSGFWEGLISFISKSRRPVILTCNDFNHSIPKDTLPLQNILLFESASKEMGRALLGEIARLEVMSRATDEGKTTVENGKQKKTISDEDIEEIIKMASDSAGQVDLRLAINQLQYIASCPSNTTAGKSQPSTSEANSDLRLVQTILDDASFADAELRRRDWLSLQVGIATIQVTDILAWNAKLFFVFFVFFI